MHIEAYTMGYQGAEVQILSRRPKFPKKNRLLWLVFYACDLAMTNTWCNDGEPHNTTKVATILILYVFTVFVWILHNPAYFSNFYS